MQTSLATRLRARYRVRQAGPTEPALPPPPPAPLPVALSEGDRALLQQLVDGQIATAEAIDRLEAAEVARAQKDLARDAFDASLQERIKQIENREDRIKAIAGVVFLIGSGLGIIATMLITAVGDGIMRALAVAR